MASAGLLLAAAAAVLLVLLAFRLRGPGRPRDLVGPPKRRVRLADGRRLHDLLAAGDRDGALRLLRELGKDEAEARRLLGVAERVESLCGSDEAPGEAGADQRSGSS